MKRGCLICDSPLLFLFREMPRHRIELWTRGFSVTTSASRKANDYSQVCWIIGFFCAQRYEKCCVFLALFEKPWSQIWAHSFWFSYFLGCSAGVTFPGTHGSMFPFHIWWSCQLFPVPHVYLRIASVHNSLISIENII